jgi:hypothetical protein
MVDQNQMVSDLSPTDPALLAWAEYWYPIAWKGLLAAGVITAIGACAGIAFLLLQWRTSSIREQQSEWRTSSLEVQSKNADAELAKANSEIANANARAAEANQKAETERLARVRLEARLSARALSPSDSDEIKRKIEEFSGMTAEVNIFPSGTPDTTPLAHSLHSILQSAHWNAGPRSTICDWCSSQCPARLRGSGRGGCQYIGAVAKWHWHSSCTN